MSLMLPRLTEMIRADEYTLTEDQELRLMDDRQRRTRWWIGQQGAPIPGPTVAGDPAALTESWRSPWVPLNDPAEDSMAGVCVLDQDDAAQGILIWVHPTPEAHAAWQAAWDDPTWRPYMLGCETAVRVGYPAVDYRAVFRHVAPLAQVSPGSVRWKFTRPRPGATSWDVMTAGWMPDRHKRYGGSAGEIEQ